MDGVEWSCVDYHSEKGFEVSLSNKCGLEQKEQYQMPSTCSGKETIKNGQISFTLRYPNSSIDYSSRNRNANYSKRHLELASPNTSECLKCCSFTRSLFKISFVPPFSIRLANLTSWVPKHSIEQRRHCETDSIPENRKTSIKLKQPLEHCHKSNKAKHQHFRTGKVCFGPWLQTLLIILLCALQVTSVSAGRYGRLKHWRVGISSRRMKPKYLTHPFVVETGRNRLNKKWLYPSVVNLASQAVITSNATCGEMGPVKYCKLVEHVDLRITQRRKQCSTCDATSSLLSERHSILNAIDGKGNRWWQSPTIEQGYRYHWVTVTLDLRQVFQVAYVIIKAANSPRPGNWILEKSIDGVRWQPWQYFAVSNSECFKAYGIPPTRPGAPRYRYDTQVTCTSYFSQLIPLENGEIHVSLINGRPSADRPSPELVTFTSARYVRLRMQKIRTLHGDLMTLSYTSPEYADPLVTRRKVVKLIKIYAKTLQEASTSHWRATADSANCFHLSGLINAMGDRYR